MFLLCVLQCVCDRGQNGVLWDIGEPLDWVPHGKTVRWTVLPPLLIFLFGWGFHALRDAAKGVAFGNYSLLKKAGENFRLVFNHSACYFLIIS